jgi:hypothetical protein
MAVYKVNVSLPPTLVDEIDQTAAENGMTRSGFIREASARYVADLRNLSAEEQRKKDITRFRETMRRVGREIPPGFDYLEARNRGREPDRWDDKSDE